jgi:hypothetical protein
LHNVCSGNTVSGIHATGAGNRIDANNAVANGPGVGGIGIKLDAASGNFVTRNSAHGNGPANGTTDYTNVPATAITTNAANGAPNTVTASWTNFSF